MASFLEYTLLLTVTFFSCVHSFVRVDLNGMWTVAEERPPYQGMPMAAGVKTVGKVPGTMYTAFMDHAAMPDPLYRDNDVKFAWMGQADWSYSRTFSVPSAVVSAHRALLVCEGLDTIATVTVNGKMVGKSENMFVRSAFEVTGLLQNGNNNITVYLKSPVKEALARTNISGYVVPPECPPAVQNGQCHVNQIRKEQCSFSWDWGPSFPTMGIWKPIYIDAFDSAVIREATAVVKKVGSTWQVEGEVFFDVISGTSVTGQLTATMAGLNLTNSQNVSLSSTQSSAKFLMTVPNTTSVSLWWPNGYGNHELYELDVIFTSGMDKSQRTMKIGFRTVELVQDPVSSNTSLGLSFYFKINGMPVFLKGTNWIPADSFQERITPSKLQYLLQSAAAVRINSMRVWGGGIYESDDFYQLCDELGIMVWQDLMFSVAMYPTYEDFLQSVATEITQQVRRLKSHPSIIVWAGNNENEKGLRQDWFGTNKNFTLYYNDYVKLYVTTIMPILKQEDDTREYVVSSPSDGKESNSEGYVAKNPGSELYGDIHFYDYAMDQWNSTGFRIPRMASEYGIQAWCNNESLAKVFDPPDYSVNSAMASHRQHHAFGNVEMSAEVGIHLKLPSSADNMTNFADFIYLTQINQAMSMRTQTEHYRRHQSKLLSDGRGLTMGAMYWQLNDIWQAPTWASIDYEGRWKMLHYYARNFFSRLLVSPYLLDPDTLDVFVVVDEIPSLEVRSSTDNSLSFKPMIEVSDVLKSKLPTADIFRLLKTTVSVTSSSFTMSMYDYRSFTPLHSWQVTYDLKTTAESVLTKNISELLNESGCTARENCLLYIVVMDPFGWFVEFETWLLLAYPKVSNLQPAHITITSVTKSLSTKSDLPVFSIEITSDAIALFVWLSAGSIKGYFSDNGFLMITNVKTITFYAQEVVTVVQLRAQLKVRSVTDVKSEEIAPLIG